MCYDKFLTKFNVHMKRKKCLVTQKEKYFFKIIQNTKFVLVVNNLFNGKTCHY